MNILLSTQRALLISKFVLRSTLCGGGEWGVGGGVEGRP